jgi:hypothetical protein
MSLLLYFICFLPDHPVVGRCVFLSYSGRKLFKEFTWHIFLSVVTPEEGMIYVIASISCYDYTVSAVDQWNINMK